MSSAEMAAALDLETIDAASLSRWLARERDRVVANFRQASKRCGQADWSCVAQPPSFAALAAAGRSLPRVIPAAFLPWHQDLAAFSHGFALEQMRLASLFPSGGNETDVFSKIEWTGDALPDRTFALTFDDGPTASGGTTDRTLAMLEAHHKSAAFFLLGTRLEQRLAAEGAPAVAALYHGQCVASHGWEHHSHATWNGWQESVTRTKALLGATFPPNSVLPLFRPPNGQRRPDSGDFFAKQSIHIALWNVDTYDWNRTMDGDAVAGRVVTLILIRRHGVLLFHDLYGNALEALPTIFATLKGTIEWPDCHSLSRL